MSNARLVIYRRRRVRRNQQWRWRLVAPNGRKLCHSGEGYANYDDCANTATLILGGAYQAAKVETISD